MLWCTDPILQRISLLEMCGMVSAFNTFYGGFPKLLPVVNFFWQSLIWAMLDFMLGSVAAWEMSAWCMVTISRYLPLVPAAKDHAWPSATTSASVAPYSSFSSISYFSFAFSVSWAAFSASCVVPSWVITVLDSSWTFWVTTDAFWTSSWHF